MSQYYLRLEAVNLSNFTADTQDLSTIRGGSLLLLGAVESLKDELPNIRGLKEVSTGASVGLYEFEADDDIIAQNVREQVEDSLRQREGLRYATVMVDVLQSGSQFVEDLQALIARNRWRQMQTASVILDTHPSDKLCEIDKVRPAVSQRLIKGQDRWVSQSVLYRREYGREKKQDFYQQEIRRLRRVATGRVIIADFVYDLEELASNPSKGNLHGKIAIIHLDGNRFGAIKQQASNRDEWQKFDQEVKTYRRQVLETLLDAMGSDRDWRTDDGRYRIETLLWGGDELTWVVPAWKGWETLNHFYYASQSWKFNGKPLRHAAGIVFCHYNAPIHRLTKLADDLTGQAKPLSNEPNANRFAYEVLESFDHVGSDFVAYRQTRCVQPLEPGKPPDLQSLVLDAEQMQFLQQQARDLREKLQRRKLHDVVENLCSPSSKRTVVIKDFKDRLKKAGVADTQVQEFEERFGVESCWLHLQALWDYLI
jgi:hypothetical protein